MDDLGNIPEYAIADTLQQRNCTSCLHADHFDVCRDCQIRLDGKMMGFSKQLMLLDDTQDGGRCALNDWD